MSSHQGYLLKKGRIIKSNLKKRYFQLLGKSLYFWSSKAVAAKGVGSSKGSDDLNTLQAALLGEEQNGVVPIHLILAQSEIVYYVHCPTPQETVAEAQRWVKALQSIIVKQIKSVIQGQLEHSKDRGKTWTPRYVMLLPEELLIFDSKEASECSDPLGSALERLHFTDDFYTADAGAAATSNSSKSHPYAFQVCDLGNMSYYLAAPDAQHKMFWMMAISKIIESLLRETVVIGRNSLKGAIVINPNPLQAAADYEAEQKKTQEQNNRAAAAANDDQCLRGTLIYDFEAQNDGEITVNKGETVLLVEQIDSDFWIVQYKTQRGFVQSDYIKVLEPIQKAPPQRKKRDAPPVPSRRNKTAKPAKPAKPTKLTKLTKPNNGNNQQRVSTTKTPTKTPRGSTHPGAPPPIFSSLSNTVAPKGPPPPVPNRAMKPSTKKDESRLSRRDKIQALTQKRKAMELAEKQAKAERTKLEKNKQERVRKEQEEERIKQERLLQEEIKRKKEAKELKAILAEEKRIEKLKQKQRRASVDRKKFQIEKDRLEQERKQMQARMKKEKEEAKQKRLLEQKLEVERKKKLVEQQKKEDELMKEQKARKEQQIQLKKEQAVLEKQEQEEKAKKIQQKVEAAQKKSSDKSMKTTRRSSMSMGKNIRTKPKEQAVDAVKKEKTAPKRKKKGGGGIAARMAMWNKRTDDYQAKQEGNLFSDKYKGGGVRSGGNIPKKGEAGYGQAVAGSETAKRAAAAKAW